MYFFPSSFGLKTYTCVTLCLKLKQRSLFCLVFCGSQTIASENVFLNSYFLEVLLEMNWFVKVHKICIEVSDWLWGSQGTMRSPMTFPLCSLSCWLNRILRVLSEDCIWNSTVWCIGCLFFLYNIGTAFLSSSNVQPGSPLLKEIVFLRSECLVTCICLFFLEKTRSPCLYVVSMPVTIFEISFFLI